MSQRKEKFMSDNMWGFFLGTCAIMILYVVKYNSLSDGWRFWGMVAISLISGIAIQLTIAFFNKKRSQNIDKKRSSDMCRTLGIPPDSTKEEDISRCWMYLIERHSPELLVNRLSDAIGTLIVLAYTILSVVITLWYIGMIIYFSLERHYNEPILLWLPLMSHILLSFCIFIISAVTNIFFNRLPGEAKAFNKRYDALVEADSLLASDEFRKSLREESK
ncbi:hypothetical protein [Serratia sp. (in: enterobacteria)]|uniref:hypothetical protein n=1 Tax=Serratia sp. (in: enterobacteria) TaxID=616 RepID=UPI00398931AB